MSALVSWWTGFSAEVRCACTRTFSFNIPQTYANVDIIYMTNKNHVLSFICKYASGYLILMFDIYDWVQSIKIARMFGSLNFKLDIMTGSGLML